MPFFERETTPRNDGTHGADWQYPSLVLGNDHLFRCRGIPPLLMASRLPNKCESVSFQNCGDLSSGEAGRPAITQP